MSVNVCIQKILLLTSQILNCEVQNTYLKSIIFKLHRKVELGIKTINYLQYYFIKQPEKFNSKQTSNTLIGFLASLDSNYQYINPVEDVKGGFLNQLLGLSEDNVKREFYFLLQSLDESIIEVQNILEGALNKPFNELPDLGTLSPLPPSAILPLSPTSPLNESFSSISETAQKTKADPIKPSSNQQSINSVLDTKTDQDKVKLEPISLPSDSHKIEDKPTKNATELTQAMNGLNISKPENNTSNSIDSERKDTIPVHKPEPENITVSNKINNQAMNTENINEVPVNKEDNDNVQPVPVSQNPVSAPVINDNDFIIRTNDSNLNSEQSASIAASESHRAQDTKDTQTTSNNPSQSVSETVTPAQDLKAESSTSESQAPNHISNNNENATSIHKNQIIENNQKPSNEESQPLQNSSLASNADSTVKNSDIALANASNQQYSQNGNVSPNITPIQQQHAINNQTQQPCNQNNTISSHTSPAQQQAVFNNQIQQPCSPNQQQFSHPGSYNQNQGAHPPNQIYSPAQPIHPGSPHHISSPTQPAYPISPNQQPYPCSPTQPIYPGSPNHITSPIQPIIPGSPSHFSGGSPNSLYSNQNQPPPLPHRPSPLPSPEQHYIPPPASLFPQISHYQNNNTYAPPYGNLSPAQQYHNPGYGGTSPYQSPPPPQFRPNQPYQHGHTHSAHMPNFNDSLAFPPMNQFIRPNSPGYINPPQFGGYNHQPPSPNQLPQIMMPSPDQYLQSNTSQHSNYRNNNNNRRDMPMP